MARIERAIAGPIGSSAGFLALEKAPGAIDSAGPNDLAVSGRRPYAQQRRTDPRIPMGGVNIMAPTTVTKAPPRAAKPWYKILYLQVLIAILLGIVVGWLWPNLATNDWIKALGDGFIKLIKMVIAPIIFCTVVSGIAHIQDAKKVGRIGVKALVYFEVVSTFALVIGLLIGNIVRPGAGFGGAALVLGVRRGRPIGAAFAGRGSDFCAQATLSQAGCWPGCDFCA